MTMDNAMAPDAKKFEPLSKKEEFTKKDRRMLVLFILISCLSAALAQAFIYEEHNDKTKAKTELNEQH